MERERRPDREGYLDYRTRLENGDLELAARAATEWHDKRERSSASGQYFNLHFIEQAIERHQHENPDLLVQQYVQQLAGLTEATRCEARAAMEKAAQSWSTERFRLHIDYLEVCEDGFEEEIAGRRTEHPDETEAEAWFQAKLSADEPYLSYLFRQRADLERKLQAIAEQALEKDRTPQVDEARYAELREELREIAREKKRDRER